jgi:sec-independent protein translocase protein TatB
MLPPLRATVLSCDSASVGHAIVALRRSGAVWLTRPPASLHLLLRVFGLLTVFGLVTDALGVLGRVVHHRRRPGSSVLALDRWLLLIMVALFVLGPERLPAAAQWVGRSIRQVKAYAADAQATLNAEIGPELAQLREPLAELPLAQLRRLGNPGAAVAEFLFTEPTPPVPGSSSSAVAALSVSPSWPVIESDVGLVAAERPPTDPDAT